AAYGHWVAKADDPQICLRDEVGNHVSKGALVREDLRQFDALFMRQDPPFDMAYITATHILDQIKDDVLIVNDASEVRNAPEKIFVLKFPDLMPETLITRSQREIENFREIHGDIIVKPLYGNGGAGVFRLKKDDSNLASLLELFFAQNREPLMIQPFLKDVKFGDKRIILVDGEIAGAINRVPLEGQVRSNMHVGGRPEKVDITARDREICEALKPELKARGLIFVGIDVIGDYLTEINVTSPTGIREVEKFDGINIAEMILDVVEKKLAK
ncbi:MAG: glutathione synthase, partial [Rhizobiales bacterium]|nr:glutathione synthase [Hyphomicrobiales bacterium]